MRERQRRGGGKRRKKEGVRGRVKGEVGGRGTEGEGQEERR